MMQPSHEMIVVIGSAPDQEMTLSMAVQAMIELTVGLAMISLMVAQAVIKLPAVWVTTQSMVVH